MPGAGVQTATFPKCWEEEGSKPVINRCGDGLVGGGGGGGGGRGGGGRGGEEDENTMKSRILQITGSMQRLSAVFGAVEREEEWS